MLPLSWARRIADRIRGLPARPRGSRGAGWDWERAAERALVAAGYRILERNFVSPHAGRSEIDLVAEENGILCFVEVKGRRSVAFGSPAEAITAEKQRRIIRAARAWLARSKKTPGRDCRFDVVCVSKGAGLEPAIEIIRDAFRLPDGY
ncbi:MAG TPA: YraN family protein [Thermoanaerobaculia bacterium]|nr:YraN family protein [Thermoanaerobaculia bacterium]